MIGDNSGDNWSRRLVGCAGCGAGRLATTREHPQCLRMSSTPWRFTKIAIAWLVVGLAGWACAYGVKVLGQPLQLIIGLPLAFAVGAALVALPAYAAANRRLAATWLAVASSIPFVFECYRVAPNPYLNRAGGDANMYMLLSMSLGMAAGWAWHELRSGRPGGAPVSAPVAAAPPPAATPRTDAPTHPV